jgi:hypothetical protein
MSFYAFTFYSLQFTVRLTTLLEIIIIEVVHNLSEVRYSLFIIYREYANTAE